MTADKYYRGTRDLRFGTCDVVIEGEFEGPNVKRLAIRHDIRNHSTDFEWGYAGSGPAQLALALLADALGDDDQALALHQIYKSEIVANLPYNEWTISRNGIIAWATGLNQPVQ